MFYDTLQKLSIKVLRLAHVKDVIYENVKKIRVLTKLFHLNSVKMIE